MSKCQYEESGILSTIMAKEKSSVMCVVRMIIEYLPKYEMIGRYFNFFANSMIPSTPIRPHGYIVSHENPTNRLLKTFICGKIAASMAKANKIKM